MVIEGYRIIKRDALNDQTPIEAIFQVHPAQTVEEMTLQKSITYPSVIVFYLSPSFAVDSLPDHFIEDAEGGRIAIYFLFDPLSQQPLEGARLGVVITNVSFGLTPCGLRIIAAANVIRI